LSQIIQKESELDFAALIDRHVVDVLGLANTRVAHGVFADDLPGYPAGWVWHGFLMSSAADAVTFMRSTLVKPLMGTLVAVPGDYPLWNSPHNGFGLMVEPGVRFGHNGGGPGYSASCFHFMGSESTGCVLMQSDDEQAAMKHLLEVMEA
jgi:D-alanyl-D-alanine carboxypeptidase